MKKNLCLLIFSIFLIFPLVSAASLGISPAKISFENTMRGGYAADSVSVVIDSDDIMGVSVETIGYIASWLNLSKKNFNVSKETPQSIKVELNVPADAANGNYTGFIRVAINSYKRADEGQMMGKIHSNLDLKVSVSVTDNEIIDCEIRKIDILNTEENDDIIFKIDIKNKGNTRISPGIESEIWNLDQSEIMQTDNFKSKEILPTTTEHLEFRIKSEDLSVSQYWANIIVPKCEYSRLLTFDLLEEGSLNSKGVLLSMVANPNGKVGEVSPIEVGFKNIGEKEVTAKFSGKVSRDGKVVKTIESEEALVSQSSTEVFSLYFTPESKGEYTISGRVLYEGKRTYEKSIKIEVSSSSINTSQIIYAVFIVFISFILFKIQKEKKTYRNKIRWRR